MRVFIFYFCYLLSLPIAVAAPQFQAVLETNEISQGETVNLQLILSDSEAQPTANADPDLSPLQGTFEVLSSQKSISSRYVNGKASAQIIWTYLIEPQQPGQLTLPALALTTANGVLHTQPQTLIVNASSQSRSDSPKLEASVSNPHPYLYEPVYYTMRFYHFGNLSDLQAIPPSNNVILEPLKELTTNRQQQIDGKNVMVTDVVYLVTPTAPGTWALEASKVKGLKANKRNHSNNNSFFSFDTNFRPFTTTSNPVSLEVRAPTQQPWLPAKNVTLIQRWETAIDKTVLRGEPLVRTLVLTAEGVGAQPLPKLEELLTSNDEFRVRSPKPETERKFQADHKTPISVVTQTFSLIPLKTGTITLPALRISWWDIEKQQMRWAELPAQTLKVVENPQLVTAAATPNSVPATPEIRIVTETVRFDGLQYTFLGISLIALCFGWWQVRRSQPISRPTSPQPAHLTLAELLRQIQATEQLTELQSLIQKVAQHHWGFLGSISLHTLAQQIHPQDAEFAEVLKKLDAALYGQRIFEPADKQQLIARISQFKRPSTTAIYTSTPLLPLNPIT